MPEFRAGQPTGRDPHHPLAGQPVPLAAPAKAVLPGAQDVPVEGIESAEVGRNGVVIVEAVQHQPQVAPLIRDRQVPHPAQGGLDLPELGV